MSTFNSVCNYVKNTTKQIPKTPHPKQNISFYIQKVLKNPQEFEDTTFEVIFQKPGKTMPFSAACYAVE